MGGTEAIAGTHPVREALRARRRRLVRLRVREDLERGEIAGILELARGAGVPVVREPAAALRAGLPEGVRDQGVVLEAGPLPELDLEGLQAAAGGTERLLVALDGVEDPRNLGALARVAEAAGAAGLVLTRRRAPPLGAVASRASAGALEHLAVARVANLRAALATLQEQGFWALGADPDAETSLWELDDRLLRGDLVVVLGAEGRGVRPGVAARLDHRVRIPMAGRVAALNVAAAAAVVLFEAARRRRGAESAAQVPGTPGEAPLPGRGGSLS
ncbi:MAG: 23S rRNA (guanosine(2251)-2'-O)-methyltransferase RlmB [Myxococcota bacterium]|nr:23S rRNA (guanosine(2251)-2'-O)-methyltransferase RlmB [Myxococcota bacterium]